MNQSDRDRDGEREDRLNQVLAGFLDEVESGVAVDRRRWLGRYPEFFDELSDFFADRDALESIAAPLRDAVRAADEDWSPDWFAPATHPETLGRLGAYEVLEWIGRGGMGVVFKGHDPALNRSVAIKVLAPQWASDTGARRRFTREAQAAAAVSHPHVITIHAVGDWQGRPYLVMEYVTGVSLQQRIEDAGPLELKEILRIGIQIAGGLAAAHAQGLIHRDIKPSNVMLENELARVKITDFGLARAVDDTRLTQHGTVAGTPQYMAPEQARGERLDRRADLFSLGSVLYAMATGTAAFRGSSTLEVIRRVCDEQPAAIAELNPEVPDWLASIVARLHAKDPADRFQSAAEVADLLGRHLARLQDPSLPPVAHRWPARPPSPPLWRRRLRSALPRACAAALLATVVALGSSAWTRWALQPATAARSAPAAPSPLLDPARLKDTYHFDFRDAAYDFRWLKIEPTGPLSALVKPDRRGLRIAIPANTGCRGVGVFTRFGVHGDFEVTVAYEVVAADRPPKEANVGPELYVRSVDGWGEFVAMNRVVTKGAGDPLLVATWAQWEGDKPLYHGKKVKSTAPSGKFRIVRAGKTVHFLAAEGASDAFREFFRAEYGAKDFDLVRLMAQVNFTPSALDVLWKDLTIRAESLPGWTGGPPKPGAFPWWIPAAGTVAAVLIGAFVWRRAAARRAEAAPPPATGARNR